MQQVLQRTQSVKVETELNWLVVHFDAEAHLALFGHVIVELADEGLRTHTFHTYGNNCINKYRGLVYNVSVDLFTIKKLR